MIKLIPVTTSEEHVHLLYALLEERNEAINISHTEMPTMQQHRKFVAKNPYRAWYVIEGCHDGKEPPMLGAVYATHQNEIGIQILEKYQGLGWGPVAINKMMHTIEPLPAVPGVRPGRWLANINPKNEPSKTAFERLGFKLVQHTYAL